MIFSRKHLAPLCAAFLSLFSAPAALADQNDAQAWFNVTYNGPISGNWLAWAEVQTRFGENVGRLSQAMIRPGVGYQIMPGLSVWAGYARIETITAVSQVGENRFWQQITWSPGQVLGGTFTTRTRLEQRLMENGNDTGWRFRELLRYEHPFIASDGISFVGTSETFMALNKTDWGARNGFDQIRNFVGLGFPVTAANARFEVGYLNQYVERPGSNDRMNHILSFNLLGRL